MKNCYRHFDAEDQLRAPKLKWDRYVIEKSVLVLLIGVGAAFALPSNFNPVSILILVGAGAYSMHKILRIFSVAKRRHELSKLIERSGGLICNNCMYILTGLPESGQCPECGKMYKQSELKNYWREIGIGPIPEVDNSVL